MDAPLTIAQLPFFASGRFPRPDLIGQCRAGGVTYTSGRELLERVRDLSLGLGALGMSRGDRVAVLSESRPDWLFVDFAVLAAGAVTVPIYPTLSTEQVGFILRDSEASLVIVSTPAQRAKVQAALPSASHVRAIVSMDPPGEITLDDVIAKGHQRILDGWGIGRAFHDEAKKVQPGDLATIIYTSGTTAEPKGVMLTHGNLATNVAAVRAVIHVDESDVALSFLPLCHGFERMVAYYYLTSGVSIVFAESFDTIARDLLQIRPTLMTGVPRVFEKLHARVMEKGRSTTGATRAIFDWAMRVADRRGRALENGQPVSGWLGVQSRLADRLVFDEIRKRIGGRLRLAVSGSAPLRPEIGRFFYGLGLPVLEGYGLTETSPVLAIMPPEAVRFGTVGRALPGVELRLGDDGEILARGPNVMSGYYKRPAETADVLRDGWFHTGDIGTIDADDYLRITDRKKELIVTSGGKKIAPQPIEAAMRKDLLVAEAVLIGERRHFPAVLIVPDLAALARRLGAPEPITSDAVRAIYQQIIDDVNAPLAQFERIKKFALLPDAFSIESGEFTPTLKVKRRVIEEKYKDVIEALYLEDQSVKG